MQKPTNNFTTSKFTSSGGGQEGWDLPGLALSDIQTWLKLRTRYQVGGARHGAIVGLCQGCMGQQPAVSAACRHMLALACWTMPWLNAAGEAAIDGGSGPGSEPTDEGRQASRRAHLPGSFAQFAESNMQSTLSCS